MLQRLWLPDRDQIRRLADFWECPDLISPCCRLVARGKLIAMPYSVEMNDVSVIAAAEADVFFEDARRQFDRLYREGAESGRVMCLSLHPPLIGQSQRIGYLESFLDYVTSFADIWLATGAEVAEYYMANYHDAELRRLVGLEQSK